MSISGIRKGASTATLKLCIRDIQALLDGEPFEPTTSRWRKRFRKYLLKI